MDNFVGKWKTDVSQSFGDPADLAEVMGVDVDKVKMLLSMEFGLEIKRHPDGRYSFIYEFADPNSSITQGPFKIGETWEWEEKSVLNKTEVNTITNVGDKTVETTHLKGTDRKWTTERTLRDGCMVITTVSLANPVGHVMVRA